MMITETFDVGTEMRVVDRPFYKRVRVSSDEGAAEVRPARPGDRILILHAMALDSYVAQVPVGVVAEGGEDLTDGGDPVVRFKFDLTSGDGSQDQNGFPWNCEWYAHDWALLPAETPTVEEDTRSIAELVVSLSTTEQARLDAVTELDLQRRRADVAERALADFKNRVREAVIEEAEEHDWCDRTDDWLAMLGLPGRGIHIPSIGGSVIRLKDGRIAVHSGDGSSNPWRAITFETGEGEWLYVSDARDQADMVLYEA